MSVTEVLPELQLLETRKCGFYLNQSKHSHRPCVSSLQRSISEKGIVFQSTTFTKLFWKNCKRDTPGRSSPQSSESPAQMKSFLTQLISR